MTEPHRGFDPLVPDDLSGWSANLTSVISRSWRRILPILAVAGLVPAIASTWISSITLDVTHEFEMILPADSRRSLSAAEMNAVMDQLGSFAGVVGLALVVSLIVGYISCVGWAASLRIALADAAGEKIETAAAVSYGFRAGLRMWGWYVLAVICVLVGICLCILPGIYLTVVFGLFAPVVVAEGGPALGRSLQLVHKSFGKILGRMLLLIVLVLALSCSTAILASFFTPVNLELDTVGIIVDGIAGYLSSLVVAILLTGGLLVTYAEARAAREPGLTARQIYDNAPA